MILKDSGSEVVPEVGGWCHHSTIPRLQAEVDSGGCGDGKQYLLVPVPRQSLTIPLPPPLLQTKNAETPPYFSPGLCKVGRLQKGVADHSRMNLAYCRHFMQPCCGRLCTGRGQNPSYFLLFSQRQPRFRVAPTALLTADTVTFIPWHRKHWSEPLCHLQ